MATKGKTSNKKSNVPSCSLCCKLLRLVNYGPVIEATDSETGCDDCSTDGAVVAVCINCTLCLCRVCSQYHNKKDHDTVQMPQPGISDSPLLLTCKEHDGELNHYCETCEKFVCICCSLTSHANHCCGEMEEMVAKQKNEIRSTSSKIDKMMDEFLETHDNIDQVIKRRSDEIEKIDQQYDKLFKKLEAQKQQAKQQATGTLSQREIALKEQQEKLAAVQGEVVSVKELNASLEMSSGQDVLSTRVRKQKKAMDDCIEQLLTKKQKISSQVKELDKLFSSTTCFTELDESSIHFEVLYPETFYIGRSYNITLVPLTAKNSTAEPYNSVVSIQLVASTGKVVDAEIKDNKDGSYTGSLAPAHIGKAQLTVSINGSYYKTQNAHVAHEKDKLFNQPWGIAVGKYGLLAVTDCFDHCVCIFDASNQLIKKLGNCGDKIAQFQNPLGVAFDSDNCLYIADTGNHRVQKFSMSGNFILQFGHKGMGNGQLHCPHDITIHSERAYIADSGNSRVSVFTTDGQFCNIIGLEDMTIPCSVAVNIDNKLLVACYGCKYLVSFSVDGGNKEKMCFFSDPQGFYQTNSKLNVPYGITTTLIGDIIISDVSKHKIRIFNQTGDQVKIIERSSSSSSNNIIYFPTGISVTSSGKIFLTTSSENAMDSVSQLIN